MVKEVILNYLTDSLLRFNTPFMTHCSWKEYRMQYIPVAAMYVAVKYENIMVECRTLGALIHSYSLNYIQYDGTFCSFACMCVIYVVYNSIYYKYMLEIAVDLKVFWKTLIQIHHSDVTPKTGVLTGWEERCLNSYMKRTVDSSCMVNLAYVHFLNHRT